MENSNTEAGYRTTEFWLTLLVTALGAVGTVLSQVYGTNMPEWARVTSIIAGTLVTLLPTVFYQKSRTERKNMSDSLRVESERAAFDRAVFDQLKSEQHGGPRSMDSIEGGYVHSGFIAVVALIALLFAVSGCGAFQLKRYDPDTSRQISKTVDFEKEDFALTLKALEDGSLTEQELFELQTRHHSEITRLMAWMRMEEAKKTEDERVGN